MHAHVAVTNRYIGAKILIFFHISMIPDRKIHETLSFSPILPTIMPNRPLICATFTVCGCYWPTQFFAMLSMLCKKLLFVCKSSPQCEKHYCWPAKAFHNVGSIFVCPDKLPPLWEALSSVCRCGKVAKTIFMWSNIVKVYTNISNNDCYVKKKTYLCRQ